MNNNIEDIYIGANYNSNNKKSKNIVLFFIIFLLLILVAMIVIYMYFFNTKTISTKQLFFNHLSNNNVQELVSESMYEDLYDKILNTNYEVNSKINFSTNFEHEKLEEIDISKFTFNLNSNRYNNKTYSELGINYSGNEELKIKLLTNEESIGIAEDEIVNKYVGIHYNNIKDLYGINIDKEKINALFATEKNDLTDEDKKQLVSSNINKALEMIPEEKFTIQDNIAISQGDSNIPVTAYTLTLSQTELNNILVEVLKNVRNSEEMLNKIIYKANVVPNINIINNNVTITPITEEQSEDMQSDDMIDQNQEEQGQEENLEQPEGEAEINPNIEPISGEVNEFNDPQVIEGENQEEEFYDENQEDITQPEENSDYIPELELTHTPSLEDVGEENNIDLKVFDNIDEYADIIKLFLGLKISKTQVELEEILDNAIENVDEITGNGLKITVYASKEKTEKISIVLPNENTIEVEILKKSDSENKMKLTYLYKGNNSIFANKNEDETEVILNDDEVKSVEQELIEEQTNGISIDISKIKTATNISIDATINYIENEKINRKINIKSDINDVTTSNSVNNSLIVTVATNENESKVVADTTFKFLNSGENIQDLTDENCLFLETLSPEDYEATMKAIEEKIDYVWGEKKEHFGFIDTNTSKRSIIDRALSNITRDEARQALENKISSMIGEAGENGQEFTIQNLENLQIDGYEVSSVVNENEAVIVVDIYTFNVNSEFNITDA